MYYAVKQPALVNAGSRDSIGGGALLKSDSQSPVCRICGERMLLFFQFDIKGEFLLPFKVGSHLVVMMCPHCNEIPSFSYLSGGRLPPEYWNSTEGHFYAALFLPESRLIEVQAMPYLQSFGLTFQQNRPSKSDLLRVGGEPFWLQDSLEFVCSCGTHMQMICQLSENFAFPKVPDAPEQPDGSSVNDYCLFLGNEVYVFACPNQCNERAVWIAVQS